MYDRHAWKLLERCPGLPDRLCRAQLPRLGCVRHHRLEANPGTSPALWSCEEADEENRSCAGARTRRSVPIARRLVFTPPLSALGSCSTWPPTSSSPSMCVNSTAGRISADERGDIGALGHLARGAALGQHGAQCRHMVAVPHLWRYRLRSLGAMACRWLLLRLSQEPLAARWLPRRRQLVPVSTPPLPARGLVAYPDLTARMQSSSPLRSASVPCRPPGLSSRASWPCCAPATLLLTVHERGETHSFLSAMIFICVAPLMPLAVFIVVFTSLTTATPILGGVGTGEPKLALPGHSTDASAAEKSEKSFKLDLEEPTLIIKVPSPVLWSETSTISSSARGLCSPSTQASPAASTPRSFSSHREISQTPLAPKGAPKAPPPPILIPSARQGSLARVVATSSPSIVAGSPRSRRSRLASFLSVPSRSTTAKSNSSRGTFGQQRQAPPSTTLQPPTAATTRSTRSRSRATARAQRAQQSHWSISTRAVTDDGGAATARE